jgi:hypothetical protein
LSLNDRGSLKQSLIDLFTLILNISSVKDGSGVNYLNKDKFIQNLKNLLYSVCPNAVSLKPNLYLEQAVVNNQPIKSLPNLNLQTKALNTPPKLEIMNLKQEPKLQVHTSALKNLTLKNLTSGTINYTILLTNQPSKSGSIGNNGSVIFDLLATDSIRVMNNGNSLYIYPNNYANGSVLGYKDGQVSVIPLIYTAVKNEQVVKSLPIVSQQAVKSQQAVIKSK